MTDLSEGLTAALAERYAIQRELGRGGMATVYLADDLRHNRPVAVKVLKPELATALGPDRFLREIEVTAQLHHPMILPLLDSGSVAAGQRGSGAETLFYVMPYVEGESLRDRLDREQQLPLEDALQITKDVAEALGYAHSRGVIHRDIKPENILLESGHALVADFGIAKAVTEAGGEKLTGTGMSIGTPAYMSPEQATGARVLDARTDVYSLSCVLYEMLVGEPPHTGPTAQVIIGKTVADQHRPASEVRASVPVHVDLALDKGLAKLPADRFVSAAEFADALQRPTVLTTRRASPTRQRGPIVLVGALALAVTVAAWGWMRPSPSVSAPVRHVHVVLPADAPVSLAHGTLSIVRPALALSPDGSLLAYAGKAGDSTALYVRPLDADEVRQLPGTGGAFSPFFSPDGQWIGFFTTTQLKKVPIDGGEATTLCDVVNAGGGSWMDTSIVFTQFESHQLYTVSTTGGVPKPLGDWALWPDVIPGTGDWVVSSREDFGVADPARIPWTDSDFASIDRVGTMGRYVSPRYLAFGGENGLWVLPVDLRRREVTGEAFLALPGVRREADWRASQVAFSREGTVAYVAGPDMAQSRFAWLDANGGIEVLPFPAREHSAFALSPDGSRIAVNVPPDLWMLDLERGTSSRLTNLVGRRSFIAAVHWRADGEHVSYLQMAFTDSSRTTTTRTMRVDGTGDAEVVYTAPGDTVIFGVSWSPDGTRIAGQRGWQEEGTDVVVIDPATGTYEVIAGSPAMEYFPTFSPDGRWIAYESEEGGDQHIFVQPYPPTGERWQISTENGLESRWSADGRELIFRSGNRWVAVPIQTEPTFRAGRPRAVGEGSFINVPGMSWDMTADGTRFLVLQPADTSTTTRTLHVIFNWIAELERHPR